MAWVSVQPCCSAAATTPRRSARAAARAGFRSRSSTATVVIVGPSTRAKSTLLALMARAIDPGAGSVFIGGHGARTLQPSDLRKAVQRVGADPGFFSGTLRDALRLGAPEADEESLRAALRSVAADELVDRLDDQIGERGNALSGGERQRVALAPALLARPRILLLDDATTAIDALPEGPGTSQRGFRCRSGRDSAQ